MLHTILQIVGKTHSNNNNNNHDGFDEHHEKKSQQSQYKFHLLPAMTPFHFRRHVSMSIKCFRSVRSPEWRSYMLDLVESHHIDLHHMCAYYMERAITNQLMRDIVHSIKCCCESTLAVSKSHPNNNGESNCRVEVKEVVVPMWIDALRKFRDVYNCLIHGGKEVTCCVYIEK